MAQQKKMVFHYPFPLPEESTSGSKVRLTHMVTAFRDIGYEVEVISGFAKQRRSSIRRVKTQQNSGVNFDFVYSEASTQPSLKAKRNILYPFLDFRFFHWCRQKSIPIGLFYRDILWRFDHYKLYVPFFRRIVGIPLYWFDWINYLKLIDHLFIPSLAMYSSLPTQWPKEKISEIFPGADIVSNYPENQKLKSSADDLQLFYVGGVRPPIYDLMPLFDSVRSFDGITLTLCCRESEWEEVKSYYLPFDEARVRVIHTYGEGLKFDYMQADVFSLIWKPHPYLDFAMPVKIFESLGYGLPIVTMSGTEASRFIENEDIGWVVSSKQELLALLEKLRNNPEEIKRKRRQAEQVRIKHTWQQRAIEVANILTSVKNGKYHI